MVEIILTQEVLKLGSKGDVVKVANGYARNCLFPKRLAIPATMANKGQIGQMKVASDREAARLGLPGQVGKQSITALQGAVLGDADHQLDTVGFQRQPGFSASAS